MINKIWIGVGILAFIALLIFIPVFLGAFLVITFFLCIFIVLPVLIISALIKYLKGGNRK